MFDKVRSIIDSYVQLCSRDQCDRFPFKATEIFSEGWMLRLLVSYLCDCSPSELSDNDARFICENAKRGWRSEGLLYPMFRAERPTYADGIIGDIKLRDRTKWGFEIKPITDAKFAVLEAKLQAPLSKATVATKCDGDGFNQAARNIACIAGLVAKQKSTGTIGRLVVMSPALHVDTIGLVVNGALEVIRKEVNTPQGRHVFRGDVCDKDLFLKCAEDVANASVALSWESMIEAMPHGAEREYIASYYDMSCRVNNVR